MHHKTVELWCRLCHLTVRDVLEAADVGEGAAGAEGGEADERDGVGLREAHTKNKNST